MHHKVPLCPGDDAIALHAGGAYIAVRHGAWREAPSQACGSLAVHVHYSSWKQARDV